MRRPAVFFDRDNTLIVGRDYLGDPAGVHLVAGAAAAVAQCRRLGFAVIVVSNQSGVARGMFTENDVRAVDDRMDSLLRDGDSFAVIDRHEYCPHHPDGSVSEYAVDCDCRKGKPGMLLTAAHAMALDLPASWMIGDAPRDVAAGKAAGCRTILIIDRTLAPSPAALAKPDVDADFTVGSLVEAVEVVTQQAQRPAVEADVGPMIVPELKLGPPATSLRLQPETPPPSIADALNAAVKRPTPPADRPVPRPESPPVKFDTARLETLGQQVLMELKKLNDARHDDFSISTLLAGIFQTLALAALPVAYVLYRNDAATFQAWLLTAIFLQAFTVALLLMAKPR